MQARPLEQAQARPLEQAQAQSKTRNKVRRRHRTQLNVRDICVIASAPTVRLFGTRYVSRPTTSLCLAWLSLLLIYICTNILPYIAQPLRDRPNSEQASRRRRYIRVNYSTKCIQLYVYMVCVCMRAYTSLWQRLDISHIRTLSTTHK